MSLWLLLRISRLSDFHIWIFNNVLIQFALSGEKLGLCINSCNTHYIKFICVHFRSDGRKLRFIYYHDFVAIYWLPLWNLHQSSKLVYCHLYFLLKISPKILSHLSASKLKKSRGEVMTGDCQVSRIFCSAHFN